MDAYRKVYFFVKSASARSPRFSPPHVIIRLHVPLLFQWYALSVESTPHESVLLVYRLKPPSVSPNKTASHYKHFIE